MTKLKVTPSFCFAFKIPDDPTKTNMYFFYNIFILLSEQILYKQNNELNCFDIEMNN